MKRSILGAAVLFSGTMSCAASIPPPNDLWAAAQADVGRAQSAGAAQTPDAKLHLQLAQEELQNARRLIGSDNWRATTLTELARVDARLALSLAKDSAAEESARNAKANVNDAQTK
jgi:hypothetical protein